MMNVRNLAKVISGTKQEPANIFNTETQENLFHKPRDLNMRKPSTVRAGLIAAELLHWTGLHCTGENFLDLDSVLDNSYHV